MTTDQLAGKPAGGSVTDVTAQAVSGIDPTVGVQHDAAFPHQPAAHPAVPQVPHFQPSSPPRPISGLRTDVDSITDFKSFAPVERIAKSTVKSCLKGEFAYLDQLFLNVTISQDGLGEMQQIVENEGQVSYKPHRAKHKITNLQNWLESWANYEKLLIQYHGMQLYETMWQYRQFICECDWKFNWATVAMYDIRHRCILSRKSLNFAKVNTDIQAQLLDVMSIKVGA